MTYSKWSENIDTSINTDVLLVDTLGDLLFFYSVSEVTFVGGSLFDVGGHNLMEPAILMKPIMTGPKLDNVYDIASQFMKNHSIIIVNDFRDISRSVIELFKDEERCKVMAMNAMQIIENNKGSKEKILKLIRPLLKSSH